MTLLKLLEHFFTTFALCLLLFSTILPTISANLLSTDQTVLRAIPIASLGARVWEVLGPFPTGMREQDFGADPLEAFGGIDELPFSDVDRYPSELADNGTVGWFKVETNSDGKTVGPIFFEGIRWSFNQLSQGWAINQFQFWARSTFVTQRPTTVLVQCANVGEFHVDSRRLSGDWYAYGTVPHVLHLSAGTHEIRVRVINEIRIFGGKVPPPITFRLEIEEVPEGTEVLLLEKSVVVPDVVEGVIAGGLGSVTIENVNTWKEDWVEVIGVEADDADAGDVTFHIAPVYPSSLPIRVAPSQARPVAFKISFISSTSIPSTSTLKIRLKIHLRSSRGASTVFSPRLTLNCRAWGETFKFTFLDFDGTVHYAMAKPPRALFRPSADVLPPPILVATHGAGVEAEWPFWTDAYARQEAAWILYPTGRSSWGFDWHGPSYLNVRSALRALIKLPAVFPETNGVTNGHWAVGEESRVLYTGHSNGGQGAWYMASHFPDPAVAVLPAAGYVKIQDYVPYNLWIGNAHTDPIIRGILESSIIEYNNDLHASNMVGIPILTRTGGDDDNVPPWHSRKYARLVDEYSGDTNAVLISEIPGKGHFWEGGLSDDVITAFIDQFVLPDVIREDERFPHEFTLTVANPAGTGSKGGVLIEQLGVPYRVATTDDGIWTLRTTNVRRFRLPNDESRIVKRRGEIRTITVDGTKFRAVDVVGIDGWFERIMGKEWKFSTSRTWLTRERHPSTYGPVHQIFESLLPLLIIIPANAADHTHLHVAQKIAHEWYLYGRGDAEIVKDDDVSLVGRIKEEGFNGNLVLVGGPAENWSTREVLEKRRSEGMWRVAGGVCLDWRSPLRMDLSPSPAEITPILRQRHCRFCFCRYNIPLNCVLGVFFLHPWKSDHIALVIAGVDNDGLRQAGWLLPKRTGMMVPDWVITGPEMKWKGIGGILGAGFWDNNWQYDPVIGYLV
ncbi:hypothetical protein BC937DRAFT_89702 [Endogone sp. FLAS-F59071]|nr:hypothetical protein BC937DRAFT_89702 [Endogone sp. FLAS-F59071]|eukprot:RUS17630.1 hypothetical protein BC937DRAFT_89702 [Endogone sp. FLAS-F59071]